MPTYEYKCTNPNCENCKDDLIIEVVHSMKDDNAKCPTCGETMSKVISGGGGFRLKGHGWFKTGGY